jgi:Histidine phosphatase superfamily (branch 2)
MPTSESIPLTMMASSPRQSISFDEEEGDTLLTHPEPQKLARTGAIWQIITFTAIGLFIALASAAFAFTLRGRMSRDEFTHVDLPDMDASLLKYFGGMGPYIGGEYTPPPPNCRVSQVHMMSRHGERYPTRRMGTTLLAFAANVSGVGGFSNSIEFLNSWKLDDWINVPDSQLDQETLTGPAAGSTHMFTLGSEFRTRYNDMWNWTDSGVKLWSSNSTRVIHSAKYFASAFFGVDVPTQVEVIPETSERWGDSLTTTYVPYSR